MSRARESDEILSCLLELNTTARPDRTVPTWLRVVSWLRRFETEAVPPEILFESEDALAAVELLVRAGALDRAEDGRVSSALLRAQARRRAEAADRRARAQEALEQARVEAEAAGEPAPTMRQITSRLNGARGGRPRGDGGLRRPGGQRELIGPQLVDAKTQGKPDGFSGFAASGSEPPVSGSDVGRAVPESVCLSVEDQTGRQTEARAGTAETQGETRAETQDGTRRVSAPGSDAGTAARVGRALLAAAGLPTASWGENSVGIVRPWLQLGLEEAEILACGRRVAADRVAAGGTIRNLAWFGPALLAEAAAKREAIAPPAPQPRPVEPEPTTPEGIAWRAVRLAVERKRGAVEARTWLRDIEPAIDGDVVVLQVRSSFVRDRLRRDWAADLQGAWRDQVGRGLSLRIEVLAPPAVRAAG